MINGCKTTVCKKLGMNVLRVAKELMVVLKKRVKKPTMIKFLFTWYILKHGKSILIYLFLLFRSRLIIILPFLIWLVIKETLGYFIMQIIYFAYFIYYWLTFIFF